HCVRVWRHRGGVRRGGERYDAGLEGGPASGGRCPCRSIAHMSSLRQFGGLLRVNFSSLTARLGLVCTILVGVACAVGVLISMLAMGVGSRREAMGNVRPDRAILWSLDALSANQSSITKDSVALI